MNHFICNPFFLYFASWSIVVGLYLLGWSDIYPIISGKLLFFLDRHLYNKSFIGIVYT